MTTEQEEETAREMLEDKVNQLRRVADQLERDLEAADGPDDLVEAAKTAKLGTLKARNTLEAARIEIEGYVPSEDSDDG